MRRSFFLVALLLPTLATAGEMVKVKVQKSTIYEEPRFFSKTVASVRHGDEMEMLDEERDWVHVRFQEREGWIHRSSLTSTRLNLGTILVGGSSRTPTQDEVALAGKGFNPEVEQGYEQRHPEMNYALVDEIEEYQVAEDSLHDFIRRGGLKITEAE